MKPIYFAILGVIIGGLIVYLTLRKEPVYIEKIKEIEVLKVQIDTFEKAYQVYKYRAGQIVTKYDTLTFTQYFDSTDCNRFLDTCIADIYRMDTALKSCDKVKTLNENLALKQHALIGIQGRKIKRLEFPIGLYAGAGMGMDLQGQVRPNVNLSIGYKIPIFK